MLFQLQAQMGAGFNGAFGRAASAVMSLQKDIQALNSTQGDITAYQRQQAGIEETKKKLELLQQQYDNIQREIQETGTYSSDLQNKLLSKQAQIDKTSAALEKQTQRLDGMEAELKEAGVDTGNLTEESKRLTLEMGKLKASQVEAAKGMESFGMSGQEALEAISSAVTALGLVRSLKAVGDAFTECAKMSEEFEASMSGVGAISQASADDMARLEEEAKALGASTQYTATQAADAMGYMAMAGWDAQEMMSGMAGVMNLAAAAGEDLASTSDIVTDNLTAFGLTAADTTRFADVLAAAASNSNTSVAVMGETFRNCASIAGALGYSIEDVSVAAGLMANAGIKGANAGTALKNSFNGLLEGVTLTSKAFGTVEFSAVKADGTMRSFSETVNALRTYFGQMSEAEKVANARAIAGERAYGGLLAIINASSKDYDKLTNSINNCAGAAERMAKIRLDNLKGDITLMNSAADALKTTVGDQFVPELRTLAQLGTEVYQMLNDFVQKNPELVKAAAAFVGIIGAATAGMLAYSAAVKIVKALDVATLFTGPTGMILAAVAAVAALVAGIVALVEKANEGVPALKDVAQAAREMDEAIAQTNQTYADSVAATKAAAGIAGMYIERLEAIEAAEGEAASSNREYHNTLQLLCSAVPELAQYIDLEKNKIEGGTEALKKHAQAWEEDAKRQAQQEYLKGLQEEYNMVLLEATENEIKHEQALTEAEYAERQQAATLDRMNVLRKEAEERTKDALGYVGSEAEITEALTDEYWKLNDSLSDYDDQMKTAEKTAAVYEKAMAEDAEAVEAAKAVLDDASNAVGRINGVIDEGAFLTGEAAQQYRDLQFAIDSASTSVQMLQEKYQEAYEAALESVGGQYQIWDQAADVVAVSAGSINNALESQISYWNDYNDNLAKLGQKTGEIEGLSDVIATFADGSEESVNAIAGMASASDAELSEMVANYQSLQAAHDQTAQSIGELVTNYSGEMQTLVDSFSQSVADMNMSTEAAAAGQATIQAYIDAAANMEGRVAEAYARIGAAAKTALERSMGGVSVPGVNGFASGTESAPPGLALVGERGPELIAFRGGEQVINASETAALMRAAADRTQTLEATTAATIRPVEAARSERYQDNAQAAPITVNVTVEGDASENVVQRLHEIGQDLAERVNEIIDDRIRDERRRAYA